MILFLFFFDVEQLAKLGSTFNVLIFALVNLSTIFLRQIEKDWYQPSFRDPLYPFTQIFGIVASLLLVPQLGLLSFLFSIMVIAVGILWFYFYGRGKAQPEYGLLDIIDKDEVPVSIEENKKRAMVSIGSYEHEEHLIRLANLLGDVIVGLHIQKVPMQTDLGAAQEAYIEKEEDKLICEEFEEDVNTEECKFLEVFSHDVADTILEQVEEEFIDLLIMGWHETEGHYLEADITHKVMAHARSHLAVLRGNLPERIENIIVPFGGGDSSQYAFYLARRLGRAVGSQIKLLKIISPETEASERKIIADELKEKVKEEQKCEIDYELRERFSIVDGIIDASTEADLMVIGDTNKRFKLSLLGSTAEKIVGHSHCSTILVKRYRQLSKRGFKGYLKKKKRTRKKKNTNNSKKEKTGNKR